MLSVGVGACSLSAASPLFSSTLSTLRPFLVFDFFVTRPVATADLTLAFSAAEVLGQRLTPKSFLLWSSLSRCRGSGLRLHRSGIVTSSSFECFGILLDLAEAILHCVVSGSVVACDLADIELLRVSGTIALRTSGGDEPCDHWR